MDRPPSLSKKSAYGGLFRQMLKKCLRPGAQTPRPPGTGGKRQPCGLLPPKVAKRPEGGERNEQRVRVAPSVKIERPGKAGRYELTLEGLWALQTSRKGFVSSPWGPVRMDRPPGLCVFLQRAPADKVAADQTAHREERRGHDVLIHVLEHRGRLHVAAQ